MHCSLSVYLTVVPADEEKAVIFVVGMCGCAD